MMERVGFKHTEALNITEKVYPGIKASHDKAETLLDRSNGELSEMQQNHLRACHALKQLVDQNAIEYKIVKGIKPF